MTPSWQRLGLRNLPSMSARHRSAVLAPPVAAHLAEAEAALAQPLIGITVDGHLAKPGFEPPPVQTGPIVDAARRLLAMLRPDQQETLRFELAAVERRAWSNVHPCLVRHGLLLESLNGAQREASLDVLRAALSTRAFAQARGVMRLNGLLVQITGRAEDFGEWPYFVSLYGRPSRVEPWAWQIDGHHLNLNVYVHGSRLVIFPSFMGSEPCDAEGIHLFVDEERAGLELVQALDPSQRRRAVLRDSIRRDDLPEGLRHPINGRMVAGPFRDNVVIPYAGIAGAELTAAQRGLLRRLLATYAGWSRHDCARGILAEAETQLNETFFSWMGGTTEGDGYYYRVHSPAILIEYDQHAGTVFDNVNPTRQHTHTIVRGPNGGDYGADLLARHYRQFDHREPAV